MAMSRANMWLLCPAPPYTPPVAAAVTGAAWWRVREREIG
jgi:hypothetical protein